VTVKILFIGDIFGQPGRRIVKEVLPGLVAEYSPDLILANGENAAAGFGITPPLVEELLGVGIAVLTSGNHIWDKKEILPYLAEHADGRLLRPANYPSGPGRAPGHGLYLGKTRAGIEYAVMNLQGRVFMPPIDCPFRTADALLEQIPAEVKLRIVDVHAEATSEKIAMGWHLDGRMTAVLGTHTHVPTADETVLPGGTAYITDLGMTGPYDSVIGIDKASAIQKFLNQLPARFEVAKGDVRLSAVLIEADLETGRALSIRRVVRKA
jgi:metallophosphoesterase (TIGR00282 family)